jgi:hypothetical protein
MSEKLDELIQIPMLQEEIKLLKQYVIRLERENADLMDRLSHRRPSTAAQRKTGRFLRRCARQMLVHGSAR